MNSTQQLLVCSVVLAWFGLSCDRGSPPTKYADTPPGDPKFRAVQAIADGIQVSHSPNPVRAQRGGRSGYAFTWKYRTTVSSPRDEVRITESH